MGKLRLNGLCRLCASAIFFCLFFTACSVGTDVQTDALTEFGTPDFEAVKDNVNADGSGVMLQGFSWESHNQGGTWWTVISNSAGEIKNRFEYVWFPPCSDSLSDNGYLPRKLNDFNSKYGTEDELRNAVAAIKPAKAIGDVVINHRVGSTSWGDFIDPTFGTVKGGNYKAICSDDEGFTNDSYMKVVDDLMRGAADTGESYGSGRDLDHTNTDVQEGITKWMNEKLKNIGFVGWRYDYVRGFAGKYVGYYNEKSEAEFSVGELWPSYSSRSYLYDIINDWISSTEGSVNDVAGRASRAFDFVLKDALNSVFGKSYNAPNSNYGALADECLLLRKSPGSAVTFVDNHDTGSTQNLWPIDAHDIGTAYVFILTHPGYPCVAWQHYFASGTSDCIGGTTVPGTSLTYQKHINYLIALRQAVGISDTGSMEVLSKESGLYAAQITGTAGSLVVSIGSSSYGCPDGYSPVYSGTNWIIYREIKSPAEM